jgi:pyrroline-5-carboxylate reductase
MKIGIIGCGSLGSTVLKSMSKLHKNAKFMVSDKVLVHRCTDSNKQLALNSEHIYLCVKPNNAKEVCTEIKNYIMIDSIIVSTMTAVPLEVLQEWLNHEKVVRTMPTMLLPNGPVVVYNPLNLNYVKFSHDNIEVRDQHLLDISTSVSGCMPGFLANIMDQWIDAAVKLGLDRELAEKLICGNINSFGGFNAKYQDQLKNIQIMVASKRGATERGISHLNDSEIGDILFDTMEIADKRVFELVRQFKE